MSSPDPDLGDNAEDKDVSMPFVGKKRPPQDDDYEVGQTRPKLDANSEESPSNPRTLKDTSREAQQIR